MKSIYATSITTALLLSSAAVQADVSISAKPTRNMSCDASVCTATAQKAVLNVNDLQTMLVSGDVTVKSGGIANNIDIDQPLTWTSASRLALDARKSLIVRKPLTVTGAGNLTVTTSDGGTNGEFIIELKASVQFWDLASSLIIDSNSYTLVGDIKTLAADIAANPSGFYALAKPYDASVDGAYANAPIPTPLAGIFEGLGNTIANLSLAPTGNQDYGGLFYAVNTGGRLLNLGISRSVVDATGFYECPGTYIGLATILNAGEVDHVWATGRISSPTPCASEIGGLVTVNVGDIRNAWADVMIAAYGTGGIAGLAAYNSGTISSSFSQGSIHNQRVSYPNMGGLVGRNDGKIIDSYSLASLKCSHSYPVYMGALIGENDELGEYPGFASTSYAAGRLHNPGGAGIAGDNYVNNENGLVFDYWDIETTGAMYGCLSEGGFHECPYVIGLTTEQFQKKLPKGFNPNIWGQSPNINSGYPYLLANPPPKGDQ